MARQALFRFYGINRLLITLRMRVWIVIDELTRFRIAGAYAATLGLPTEIVTKETVHASAFIDMVMHTLVTGFWAFFPVTLSTYKGGIVLQFVPQQVQLAIACNID